MLKYEKKNVTKVPISMRSLYPNLAQTWRTQTLSAGSYSLLLSSVACISATPLATINFN